MMNITAFPKDGITPFMRLFGYGLIGFLDYILHVFITKLDTCFFYHEIWYKMAYKVRKKGFIASVQVSPTLPPPNPKP